MADDDDKDGEVTLGGAMLIGEWGHTCKPPRAWFTPRTFTDASGNRKTSGFHFHLSAEEKEKGIIEKITDAISGVFTKLLGGEAEATDKIIKAVKNFRGDVSMTWGGTQFKTPCLEGHRKVGIRLCLDVSITWAAKVDASGKVIEPASGVNFSITLPYDWAVRKATCTCVPDEEASLYEGTLHTPIYFHAAGTPTLELGPGLATTLEEAPTEEPSAAPRKRSTRARSRRRG